MISSIISQFRAWRTGCGRAYDYGTLGRTSTDAVWLQAFYNEASSADGEVAATVLLDLQKAFESVPLARVWHQGWRIFLFILVSWCSSWASLNMVYTYSEAAFQHE